MSAKVKPHLLAAETSPLEKAGEAQDRFVATIGDLVARKLAEILDKGENEVARVSAAKALMDWIRPQKKGFAVNINNAPQFVSHLQLPKPLGEEAMVTDGIVDAEVVREDVPQIGPEPASPVAAAKLKALREIEIEPAPAAPQLPERSPTPREPDMPEKASSIRQYS